MQSLFHYLPNNAGWQRHTGTQALLGLAHPREKTHMGTQALLGSGYPNGQQQVGHCLPQSVKGLYHVPFITRLCFYDLSLSQQSCL